jgi:hypothetical protein
MSRLLWVDGPGDLVAALGPGVQRAPGILPSPDLVVPENDADPDNPDPSSGNSGPSGS